MHANEGGDAYPPCNQLAPGPAEGSLVTFLPWHVFPCFFLSPLKPSVFHLKGLSSHHTLLSALQDCACSACVNWGAIRATCPPEIRLLKSFDSHASPPTGGCEPAWESTKDISRKTQWKVKSTRLYCDVLLCAYARARSMWGVPCIVVWDSGFCPPWDLSLKKLRWCKPSKRLIQDHALQRLSSHRRYLHHISLSPSLSGYFPLKHSASTKK